MVKKNKILKIIFFTIGIYLCMVAGSIVKAVPLSISVSKTSATVEENIKVTVTSEYTGRVNLSATGGNLSESTIWVEKNSVTVTLTSTTPGSISITASPEGGKLANSEGVDVPVAAQGAKVTFNAKQTSNENPPPSENPEPPATTVKSNNADLKNLGINPNDFKGFKAGTTSYDVTVPNNVEQVNVYATAKDSKATVSGTGNKNLNVGQNALKVVVTAEDGTTKTYTINVTREADGTTNTTEENTNTVTDNVENPDMDLSNYDLTELSVEGYTLSPNFSPYIFTYTLDISSGDVTKLDIETKTKNEGITIEIVGNEDLKEGENTVTILVHNEVTGDDTTYQIIVNKTSEIDLSVVNESLGSNVEKANRVRKIIIGVIAFIALGIIIFAVVKYRMKNKYNEEDFDDDEEDDEDNDDEDDDNEEENEEEKPKALQKNMVKENEENVEEKDKTKIEGLEDIKQRSKQNDDIDDIIIQEPEEPEEKGYRKNNGKGKHF